MEGRLEAEEPPQACEERAEGGRRKRVSLASTRPRPNRSLRPFHCLFLQRCIAVKPSIHCSVSHERPIAFSRIAPRHSPASSSRRAACFRRRSAIGCTYATLPTQPRVARSVSSVFRHRAATRLCTGSSRMPVASAASSRSLRNASDARCKDRGSTAPRAVRCPGSSLCVSLARVSVGGRACRRWRCDLRRALQPMASPTPSPDSSAASRKRGRYRPEVRSGTRTAC